MRLTTGPKIKKTFYGYNFLMFVISSVVCTSGSPIFASKAAAYPSEARF